MQIVFKLAKRVSAGLLICLALAFGVGGTVVQAAPPYGSPNFLDNWQEFDPAHPYQRRHMCTELTDYQLRQRVSRHGYVNIFLGGDVAPFGNVEVKASLDGKVYLLEVDRCNGKIEAAKLLVR